MNTITNITQPKATETSRRIAEKLLSLDATMRAILMPSTLPLLTDADRDSVYQSTSLFDAMAACENEGEWK